MKNRKQLLLTLTDEEFLFIETQYIQYRIKEVKEGREPGSKQKMLLDIIIAHKAD